MDKQTIMAMASNNPQVAQAADIIESRIANMPGITEQMIDQLVATLEYVLDNPQEYPKVRESAIRAGFGSEDDFPTEFDPVLIVSMLIALYEVQARYQSGASQAFARGGLAQAAQRLAAAGRGGDSMLAHINPREAAILSRMGGGGTVNPTTGLVEFKGGVGKLVAAVAPVALSVIAPGIGTAIGAALGAGSALAPVVGGAAIGALGSAATGGNALQGAIGGALGTGGGSMLGGALAPGMSSAAQNVIGSSLAGAASGALGGQGLVPGAMQGALGGYAGNTLAGAAGNVSGPVGAGLQSAGRQAGNALAMGATPQQALIAGGLSGLATGIMGPGSTQKSIYDITPAETGGGLGLRMPSDIVVEGLKSPSLNTAGVPEMGLSPNYGLSGGLSTYRGPSEPAVDYSLTASKSALASAQPEMGSGIKASPLNAMAKQASGVAPGAEKTGGNKLGLGTAASVLPLLSLFSAAQTPQEVQQVVAKMTPEQQEYFNRPMRTWNWDTLSAAAKMKGVPLGIYIAENWDKVGGGEFDNPTDTASTTPALARGGMLQRLAAGGGTGRSDSINAKLSDGEYVMDAETVALLGDGSTNAGARRLDEMRAKIRQHKGKSMARGKFSANAKSPLAYLKDAS